MVLDHTTSRGKPAGGDYAKCGHSKYHLLKRDALPEKYRDFLG